MSKWTIPTQAKITDADAKHARRIGHETAKGLLRIEDCRLEDHHMIAFQIKNGVLIKIDFRLIPELADLTDAQIRKATVALCGDAIYIPATETYVNADALMTNILTNHFPSPFIKRFASTNLASRTSAKKAISSAENGRKGGRPKKAKPALAHAG